MALEKFRIALRDYLKGVEKSQAQLAAQLGLEPTTLSHKLNGTRGKLSNREKKEIIRSLTRWQALKTRSELKSLLELLGETESLFTKEDWLAPPFLDLARDTNFSETNIGATNNSVMSSHSESVDSSQSTGATFYASTHTALKLSPFDSADDLIPGGLRQDWHEAPEVRVFYGRQGELQRLGEWVTSEGCRLISLVGMGGLGKTSLALKLAQQLQDHFEFVKWCSLRDAPSLEDVLDDCLTFLLRNNSVELPQSVEDKISLLLLFLRNARCLLVFDNLEAVMAGGTEAGRYLPSHNSYQKLISRLCETSQPGCIILTSREKPAELSRFETKLGPIRSLSLKGLDEEAGIQLLAQSELFGSREAVLSLVTTYRGNPLQLKLVASHINNLYGSNVERFLDEDESIVGDVSDLLDQQFERLSALEKRIVYWLAVAREPLTRRELARDLGLVVSKSQLAEALGFLQRRSLLEISWDGLHFTLQPMIMEYVTQRLIKRAYHEITINRWGVLARQSLLKTEAKEYLREIQSRLILEPVLNKLLGRYKTVEAVEAHLRGCLTSLQQKPFEEQGYAPGNLINLVVKLKGQLSGYDLSYLNVEQAYLQGIALQNTDFTRSHFSRSRFSPVFGSVLSVAFSPLGDLLAISDVQGTIRLWNLQSDEPQLSLVGHVDRVRAVAFSPDGTLLASAGDDFSVRIWEVNTGHTLQVLQHHTDRVWTVAFSPNGRYLVSGGSDQTIKVWDFSSTYKLLTSLNTPGGVVYSLSFDSNSSVLASAGQDGSIRLWHTGDWQCFETLYGHGDEVTSVAFNPNSNLLASGSADHSVKLWQIQNDPLDVSEGQPSRERSSCLETIRGYEKRIWSVAFSPCGKTLAIGVQNQGVILWDVASRQVNRTLYTESANQTWRLAFHPTGTLLATGYENQMVKIWEVESGQCIKTLHSYFNRIGAVAFNRTGTLLASGGEDCLVRIWNTTTHTSVKVLEGHTNRVWTLAFSPDGEILATGSQDHTIRLWDTRKWQCTKLLRDTKSSVWSLTFSHDSKQLATCGDDPAVKVWDVSTGQLLTSLKRHRERVRVVTFSPIDKILASGGDEGWIKVWDSERGEGVATLKGHQGWVRSLAFSPDGTMLVSGGEDYSIRVWHVKSGRCLKTLWSQNSRVWSVVFSPDGNSLISGGQDHLVRLWDVKSGECYKVLRGHDSLVRAVAVVSSTKTGPLVATGSEDESIGLWNLTTGEQLGKLRSPRLYEGLNLTDVTGLVLTLKDDLKILGAIEGEEILSIGQNTVDQEVEQIVIPKLIQT